MALDVGYVSAIGAGALSFLSPCVLPLVPPYLSYMAGVSVDDFRARFRLAAQEPAEGRRTGSRRGEGALGRLACRTWVPRPTKWGRGGSGEARDGEGNL